ncbi:MAG: tyrosine-protein phosphatase [Bdellovibrionales bacterium]
MIRWQLGVTFLLLVGSFSATAHDYEQDCEAALSPRYFAALKARMDLEPLASSSEQGDLHWNPAQPNKVVRKFSGKSASKEVEAEVRLHSAAVQFFDSLDQSQVLLDIPKLVQSGDDYVVRTQRSPLVPVQLVPEAMSKLAELRRIFQKNCCLPSQALLRTALGLALADSSQMIYWDPVREKLFLPELSPNAHWIQADSISMIEKVGSAELMIGHRPKFRDFAQLSNKGFTDVVTILSPKEGSDEIGNATKSANLNWIHVPVGDADLAPESLARTVDLVEAQILPLFRSLPKRRIYLHCSAGFHRTGVVTYTILRLLGHEPQKAREILKQLRPATLSQVGSDRLADVDTFLRNRAHPPKGFSFGPGPTSGS